MNSLSSSSWGAQLSQVVPNYQKALIFGAWGAAGGAVAALLGEMIQPDFRGGSAAQLIFYGDIVFDYRRLHWSGDNDRLRQLHEARFSD